MSDDRRTAPTLPRPSDVHCHAAGFDVIGQAGAYQLRDTCTWNNWGTITAIYPTLDRAVERAWQAKEFKEGRRSTLELSA